MFIGHLPGAYLVFRTTTPGLDKAAFAAAMIGSIAPDIDLLWFYFVDNRSHHHHEYLTHRPLLWLGILTLGLLLRLRFPRAGLITAAFGAGGLVHMTLDSIVGEVAWAWPISEFTHPLVVVQATHSHWILSFLSHWTFKIEIAVTLLAAYVWWTSRRKKQQGLEG